MILKKNNLQTVQEWTKSYIELIALYVHPKNSNNLRSHLRAIMALDHSRLGLENKFLEKKSGRIFGVRRVLNCTKSCQQIWGRVNQPFYTFYTSNLRWNSTTRRCFYHTHLGQNAVDRSTRGFLEKPLKKFPKSPIRAAGSDFWLAPNFQRELSVWININRVTLRHNKELIVFIFYLVVLERCVIIKSVWYARHFEYSCKQCSWTTENKRHSD